MKILDFLRTAAFFWILALLMLSSALAETWKTGPPLPQGAEEVLGAAVGNSILVYGGLGPGFVPRGLFWMFDTVQNHWIELPSNPLPVHHAALVAVGNRAYLFGGFVKPNDEASWKPVDNAWMFDVETRTWSPLAPLPTARGALTAAVVGSNVYVIGGAALPEKVAFSGLLPNRPVKQITGNEIYDTKTDTWSKAAPIPTPRNHMGAAVLDGKIYVVGGRIGSSFGIMASNIAVNEVFDPATDTWEPRALLPTPRSGIGVVALNGRIHVLGGEEWQHNRGGVFRQHEAYDPKTNRWQLLAPMRVPRHGLAVGVVDGKIYAVSGANVAGGGGSQGEVTVMEIYLP